MPPYVETMGWMLTAHGMWRQDALAMTAKEVAPLAGYDDVKAYEKSVARHTGLTPANVLRSGGFAQVAGEIGTWFERDA